MATEAISVQHLSKLYATRDGGVAALDRISFSIGEGEFVAVVGKEVGLHAVVLIGGVGFKGQIDALRHHGAEIVIATPGRLLDHVGRRNLDLSGVKDLVLDEADHMLDLGFLPQVQDILQELPKDRRTMMFSATLPPNETGICRSSATGSPRPSCAAAILAPAP